MNLFGIFGKKAIPFNDFRSYVRQVVRQNAPKSKTDLTDNGFILTIDGTPIACNLRNLYTAYSRSPRDRDSIVKQWLDALVTEVPEQTWGDAMSTLRPMLKTKEYIHLANIQMQKNPAKDVLTAQPFVGDLCVIAVREYGGTLTAVTDRQFLDWGVTLEQAIRQGLNNMSMMGFPGAMSELRSQGSMVRGAASSGDIVGLVFEDNHLTATWLVVERFRDHLAMRLQSDFVVSVPYRGRLVAVRADEPALVASIIQSGRSSRAVSYALTSECFHVDISQTGGALTVYTGRQKGKGMDPNSAFASALNSAPLSNMETPQAREATVLVDFSQWGLKEPTGDLEAVSETTPWNRG